MGDSHSGFMAEIQGAFNRTHSENNEQESRLVQTLQKRSTALKKKASDPSAHSKGSPRHPVATDTHHTEPGHVVTRTNSTNGTPGISLSHSQSFAGAFISDLNGSIDSVRLPQVTRTSSNSSMKNCL